MPAQPETLFARHALTAEGWRRDVAVTLENGLIARVEEKPASGKAFDLLLPGMANVHSHAFQRAMAGLAEGSGGDNFWSWRKVMYRFAARLTPEHVEAVARAFYIDLLKHGYTAVGEFHYLHNDANGKPYAAPTELSDRVIAAAQSASIHITHLPVLYETANFGGVAAEPGQRRFLHTAESFIALLEALRKKYDDAPGVNLGAAPHSLRAVRTESLAAVVKIAKGPIHIHAAEQEKEVADCLSWSGQRPVEWLLENHSVDARWCLIHATHMTEQETKNLAASGATAGLCPTTEGNLGDGIFPAELYLKSGGAFGIGSDSNVCLSPFEELRHLEYYQRLATRRRIVLAEKGRSAGRTLFSRAATGGAQALGLNAGAIAPGKRADLAAFSMNDPLLADKEGDALLDALIFAVRPNVTDVWVAGARVVENGHHRLEEESAKAMRRAVRELSQ